MLRHGHRAALRDGPPWRGRPAPPLTPVMIGVRDQVSTATGRVARTCPAPSRTSRSAGGGHPAGSARATISCFNFLKILIAMSVSHWSEFSTKKEGEPSTGDPAATWAEMAAVVTVTWPSCRTRAGPREASSSLRDTCSERVTSARGAAGEHVPWDPEPPPPNEAALTGAQREAGVGGPRDFLQEVGVPVLTTVLLQSRKAAVADH